MVLTTAAMWEYREPCLKISYIYQWQFIVKGHSGLCMELMSLICEVSVIIIADIIL